MSAPFFHPADDGDPFLIACDVMPEACFEQDDDVSEILSIACESFGSRGNHDAGGAA